MKKILAVILILAIIGIGAARGWWENAQKPVSEITTETVFNVEPGMNAKQVAAELESQQLIHSALAFNIMARMEQVDASLKAGSYILSPSMSLREIIDILLKGPQPDYVVVTIPEGLYLNQIIDLLVEKGFGNKDDYLKIVQAEDLQYDFLQAIPATIEPSKRLEGFLFPDTYYFDPGSTPREIIDRLLSRFGEEVTPEVEAKLKEKDLSIFEWVTIASLIEREAAKAEDRPLISGVIYNRIKKGMPLEFCSTIQYLLGKQQAVIYFKDLEIDSPYNTYKNAGLPPGPIANPGHASLEAALNPAQTDYLYFVAKSDGYHVFAKTYQEHLYNQKNYQDPATLPQ